MISPETLSLRWNDYSSHIASAFESLLHEEDLVDVTLFCEGRKIRAHKILLSACSSYFKDIFKENPCQHPIIFFNNVKYSDLYTLVKFMYKGEVQVPQESLISLLHTANMLSIRGLSEQAIDAQNLPKTIQDQSTYMLAQKILQIQSQNMNSATDHVYFALSSDPTFAPLIKAEQQSAVSQQLTNKLLPKPTEDLTTALDNSIVPQVHEQQQTTSTTTQSIAASKPSTTHKDQQHQQTKPANAFTMLTMDEQNLGEDSTEFINVGEGLTTTSNDSNAYMQADDFEMACEDIANQSESERPSNYEMLIGDMGKDNTFLDEDEQASTQKTPDLSTEKPREKKYKCDLCTKSFVAFKSLVMHSQTHSGRTKCNICGAVLSRTANLKRHIKLKHEP